MRSRRLIRDVFNVLLQILDDGRLTDGKGRVVNFKNTVIIMTSNLGSQEILNKSYDEAKSAVKDILENYFRPEFLNRVDDIIVFKALAKEQVKQIAGHPAEEAFHAHGAPGEDFSFLERRRARQRWQIRASIRTSARVRCAVCSSIR
jgi:hypothetical protein